MDLQIFFCAGGGLCQRHLQPGQKPARGARRPAQECELWCTKLPAGVITNKQTECLTCEHRHVSISAEKRIGWLLFCLRL